MMMSPALVGAVYPRSANSYLKRVMPTILLDITLFAANHTAFCGCARAEYLFDSEIRGEMGRE
ncbi:hypothetical protein [Lentibacter sp. XHP0401]|uniref:hypothetical protein n=1 Tax=Lentibacter sp. XHP0401 TaxID=2984334 RepID=UPI0021E82FF8|nr:hypothetical protein [Lentibacter sp. XHP0401]